MAGKQHRDKLRTSLESQGRTREQIAAEMGRQFGLRARQAWRHAHGWTQSDLAERFNRVLDDPSSPMNSNRISDYENWPLSGNKPTIRTLAVLAQIFQTIPAKLIDDDDRAHYSRSEMLAINAYHPPNTASSTSQSSAPKTDTTTGQDNSTPQQATGPITVNISYPSPLPPSDTPTTINQPLVDHSVPGEKLSPRYRCWPLVLTCVVISAVLVGSTAVAWIVTTRPSLTPTRDTPTSLATPPASMPISNEPAPSAPSSRAQPVPVDPSKPQPPQPSRQSIPTPQPIPTTQHPPPQTVPPAPEEPPPITTDDPALITGTLKNLYHSTLCLDEMQEDTARERAHLQAWDCNGTGYQIWSEKDLAALPDSIAKNLVSHVTGKCVSYQPGYSGQDAQVWLAPCGNKARLDPPQKR